MRRSLHKSIAALCFILAIPSVSSASANKAVSVFATGNATLTLTSPAGGECWRSGSTENITWSATLIDSVRIEYTLNGGAVWTALSLSTPASSGTYAWSLPDTVTTTCRVRITDAADSTITDATQGYFSLLERNLNASFTVDADLQSPGSQGVARLPQAGSSQTIGFALYGLEWEQARGFTLRLSWDPAKATYRSTSSSATITDDERTINGDTFIPEAEQNILGPTLISAGEENTPGFYTNSFAQYLSAPANAAEGLVWYAVFRTAATFVPGDTLAIRAELTMADENGVQRNLGVRYFMLAPDMTAPANLVVSDVPEDQGHSLYLTWTPSPAEALGQVEWYRIYRSRLAEFTDPVPLTSFADLDSLIFYEEMHTVLIDSVAAGTSEFTDPFVPLNDSTYYYWVQAVGPAGASKPVSSRVRTAVEDAAPAAFALTGNFPNPFNPSTTIAFTLPVTGTAELTVFDITGRKVRTLMEGTLSPGAHSVVWDGRDDSGVAVSSGVYLSRLRMGSMTATGRMMLLK